MNERGLKRKAFLDGFFGFYFGKKEVSFTKDDGDAMRKDWDRVGEDLRKAMETYDRYLHGKQGL